MWWWCAAVDGGLAACSGGPASVRPRPLQWKVRGKAQWKARCMRSCAACVLVVEAVVG